MFDVSKPTLVFVTQTHHPVLNHFTGYIFAYYEFHYHKPKELFFRHIHEAQVFALYRDAVLELRPERKPDTVTAIDYVLHGAHGNDADYPEPVDDPEELKSAAVKRASAKYEQKRARILERRNAEAKEVDWFGGSE